MSKKKKTATKKEKNSKKTPNYPRHSLERSLRIPKGILDQNAGRECTDRETAEFIRVNYNAGPYSSELSSSIKFGLLERPEPGKVKLTDIARNILKPQQKDHLLTGLRTAVLNAPIISDVYSHYRGENLPDDQFFTNTLSDKYKIPLDKISEFKEIL